MSAEKINATKDVRKKDIIIAFMGPTGSGKSYFIDLLTGQPGQRAKNTTKSVTQDIEATRMKYTPAEKHTPAGEHTPAEERDIVFVDTPGFDDAKRSDMQILNMISDWLKKTYEHDVKLSGLIYLHRITDNRMSGAPHKNLRMFEELCGANAMSQVVLVTTMWERLTDPPGTGERREEELKSVFWKALLEKGSRVESLNKATSRGAWDIAERLVKDHLEKEKKAVLLQAEMVDDKIALNETRAGKALYSEYQKRLADQKARMKTVLAQVEKSKDEKLKKELKKEYEKLQRQFDETFVEAERLRRSLLQRLLSFFFRRRAKWYITLVFLIL